jgi:hypothetical protein
MSFGESLFLVGFIQKTIKGDLFIRGNYKIPPHKTAWEDSRRLQEALH